MEVKTYHEKGLGDRKNGHIQAFSAPLLNFLRIYLWNFHFHFSGPYTFSTSTGSVHLCLSRKFSLFLPPNTFKREEDI